MRILFIHQYFRTPEEGGGIRSYHMCKALLKAGHQVEVIAAHNHSRYAFKAIEGIKVHYLPVYYENKLGFVGRTYAFLKFLILATLKACNVHSVDIAYASSSPLTIGIITLALKKLKGVPFIFEVMDLWPEAPIQMGFVKNPILKKLLYGLEKAIYKKAKLVVAASPGMEAGVKAVAPDTSTITIPNMSDCDFFRPLPKNLDLIRRYNLENKFVCCYTGAIGLSNNLKKLLEVAFFLKESKTDFVEFLIAGEGGELPEIKALSEKQELRNVQFLGHLSKKDVAQLYSISDLNLIFFNSQPILETNSPNKFFDGIAAGLPTLINVKGWIKELCEDYHCGNYFSNPQEFYQIVNKFYEDKQLLNEYSKNARKLAELKFDKDILLTDFLKLFA